MPDLTPMTRQEKFLNGDTDLEPITRREYFYAGRESELPEGHQEPETREEWFIKEFREAGDVTVEEITITENGTTTAPSGKAYSPIHVNVPLPQNAYLKKTATTSISDAVRLPVASAVVSVTDKDKAELYLTSDGVVSEDNAPYLYRQSPSGKSAVDLSVVGGTVAWNQQLSLSNLPSDSVLYSNTTYTVNGVTFTKNNDGSITIQTESGGATSETSVKIGNDARLEFIKNHIHYIPRCKGGSASTYYFNYAGSRYVYDNDKIFAKQPSGFNMWLTVKQGTVITTPVKVYPQVVDLEQMFGTTIADAVYTMEEAEAGSGIAWLKSYGFLTKSYYAYNAGTLMSVNASSHDTVGFNQWDEEWEQGAIYLESGNNFNSDNRIRSKNHIHVKPNTEYYVMSVGSSVTDVFFYDENKTFITYNNPRRGGRFTVTIPSNCHYIRFCTWVDYGETYRNNICINVSDISRNGTYEPYTKHTYPLDSDLTLRGIPKLDSNNNLYYDGDVYSADGSVKRKYGIVDLGTLTPILSTLVTNGVIIPIDDAKRYTGGTYTPNGVVSTFERVDSNENFFTGGKQWTIRLSTSASGILMSDPSWQGKTANEIKALLNGIYYVYELATPTSETADAFENPQLVGSTEEFIDTRDVPIPVGQDSKYVNGNIYIKYLDSVTTGDIELADENAIIPLENTTYISSNGSASIDYWSKEE